MMNSRLLASTSLGMAVCSTLVTAIVAACGGQSTTNTAECAAGTSPQNGVCVVPDSGGADVATSADVAAIPGPDSSLTADSGMLVIDATSTHDSFAPDADEHDSAFAPDALDAEAGPVAASCPVESFGTSVVIDCDEACADAGAMMPCSSATCEDGPMMLMAAPAGFTQILRTPGAPGADPACTSDCSDGGYAYGLGFQFSSAGGTGPMGDFQMTVAPPWFIVWGGTRYCDYRDSGPGYAASCIYGQAIGGDPYYILTKDPNAPATNVTIRYTGNSFQACPADGGV